MTGLPVGSAVVQAEKDGFRPIRVAGSGAVRARGHAFAISQVATRTGQTGSCLDRGRRGFPRAVASVAAPAAIPFRNFLRPAGRFFCFAMADYRTTFL